MDWFRVALSRIRLRFEPLSNPIPDSWRTDLASRKLLFTTPDRVISTTLTNNGQTMVVEVVDGRAHGRVELDFPKLEHFGFNGWAVFDRDDPRQLRDVVGDELPRKPLTVREAPVSGLERGSELRFLIHAIPNIFIVPRALVITIEFRWSGERLMVHDYTAYPLHTNQYVINGFGYYRLHNIGGKLEVLLPTGATYLSKRNLAFLNNEYTEMDRYGLVRTTLEGADKPGFVVALRRNRVVELEVPSTATISLDRQYLFQRTGRVVTVTNLDSGHMWSQELQWDKDPIGYDDRFQILLVQLHRTTINGYRGGRLVLTYELPEYSYISDVTWLPDSSTVVVWLERSSEPFIILQLQGEWIPRPTPGDHGTA